MDEHKTAWKGVPDTFTDTDLFLSAEEKAKALHMIQESTNGEDEDIFIFHL